MDSIKYISLALEAPLQSWGTSNSAYGFHNTNRFPTRSAILMGILANIGIKREDTAKVLQTMRDIRMTTLVYSYGSIFRDNQNCNISFDKNGKPRKKNIMQYKDYIVGGRFGVILGVNDDDIVERIQNGFGNPVYPFFAGRANCPFSFHPYVGTYDNMDEAKNVIHDTFSEFDDMINRVNGNCDPIAIFIEPDTINPIEDIKICDVPLGMYNGNYKYDFRYIREIKP